MTRHSSGTILLSSTILLMATSGLMSAQINIDYIAVPETIAAADIQTYQLQTAINLAHQATHKPGWSARVIIPAGDVIAGQYKPRPYRLTKTIRVPGGVVLSSTGRGRRGVWLRWSNVRDNQTLLHFSDGHAGGLENVAISVADTANGHTGKGAIGLLAESQSSAVFENFTIDMSKAGTNAIGFKFGDTKGSRNTESVTVQKFNIHAPKPVVIASGDNLVIGLFDLTVIENHSDDGIAAVFQNENAYVPANVVIGPGTGQLGDHAIAFTGRRERDRGTGDSLTVQNFRWEQGTAKGPAWLIDVFRFDPAKPEQRLHAIESVVFLNCRSSLLGKRKTEYVSRKIPKAGVLSIEFIGGYYPGRYEQE